VDEDCSGGDCTGNGVFAQVYGEGVGMRIARDANDAVLLTGTVSGTVNFGGDNIIASSASGDGYVVKLDHAFGHLWDLHLTGNSVEEPRGIAVDPSGNVAVAGRFQTELVVDGTTYPGVGEDEIFVLRLSPAGAVQWVKVYANNINQQARAVAMDSTGATIVAGYYEGTLDFGGGHVLTSTDGWDMFLLKLDGAGNTLWAKSYGGTGADMLQGVAVDGDDNIFVVGNYAGQMTFGCLTHAASSEGSGLIAKLAANGDCVWSDAFGGAGEQTVGLDVEVDSGGRPVFGGAFTGTLPFPSSQLVSNGNMDTFVAKYTATGLHMWSLSFGGAGLDEPCFVAVDPVDAVVVTGRTQSDLDFGEGLLTNHGSQDLFVAKYAGATGALVWGRLIGDADYQAGFNVTTDRLGWPILTGQITGTVDFGNGPLSTSLLNAFIAKLEP
jgi:hypothetical protein